MELISSTEHPITKWIKSQHLNDKGLLRSRLLTLHWAANVSSHNRTTATARRPGYQRVKNTTYVFIFFVTPLFRVHMMIPLSVFTNGSPYNVPVGSTPTVHNTRIITQTIRRENSLSQTTGSSR